MARYIDANVFVDRLFNAWDTADKQKRADIVEILANVVTPIVVGTPTADVEEVRPGEWLPVQYTYFGLKRYECSECKDDEYWQKRYLEHKEKYCPNCGAKMDGGKEE